jgi:hypothetical protein
MMGHSLINMAPLYAAILSNRKASSRPDLPPSMFVNDQWVNRGLKTILWLPSGHGPSWVAVYGRTICIFLCSFLGGHYPNDFSQD